MPARSIIAPGGPKLPRIDRQSPASRTGSVSHMAATLTPADPLIGQVVDHAHETEADDADPYH